MFPSKAPSLLAFDKERAESIDTIYGITRVPWKHAHARNLDPVSPKLLRPMFKSLFRQLQRGKALAAMTFLDGHYLVALDGGLFSSKTITVLVSPPGPPQWVDHLYPSDVGGGDYSPDVGRPLVLTYCEPWPGR